MTDTKHTPTPWDYADKVNQTSIYGKGYEKPIAITDSYSKGFGPDVGERIANAADIVKCVNLHDELVGYCTSLINCFDELKATINAERIVTGRSTRQLHIDSNLAIEGVRESLKKAGAL